MKTESGKIGGKPRVTTKHLGGNSKRAEEWQIQYKFELAVANKLKEGFKFLAKDELHNDHPSTFPSDLHLWIPAESNFGFQSLDFNVELQQLVAVAGASDEKCHILFLNCSTGDWIDEIEFPEFDAFKICFVSTEQVALQCDDRVHLIDISDGQYETIASKGLFPTPQFDSKNGLIIYTVEDRIETLNISTGEIVFSSPPIVLEDSHEVETQCVLSPSGKTGAYSVESGKIEVIEFSTGTIRTIVGNFPYCQGMEIHPDDKTITVSEYSSESWATRTFNLKTKKEDPNISFENTMCFAIHPNGKIMARQNFNQIEFRDLNDGNIVAMLEHPFLHKSVTLQFSTDGKKLVTRTDWGIISIFDMKKIMANPNDHS